MLTACGLPRSGPYFGEITSDKQLADYGFNVLDVTPEVTRITRVNEASGFTVNFIQASPENTSTVAKGDVLAITVWENIDEGLLNPAGVGATPLPNSVVDEQGRVFVPYVGLIQAAGRTLNQVREIIRSRLAEKTLNPQVDVFPVDPKGRQISIQGSVSAPGIYPIDTPSKHILAMIAKAGGVSLDPEIVRLKLRRGNVQAQIWLQDLYDDPRNDVHLRNGDAIIAERDRRIFTALGAVSGPSTIPFPQRDVSVITALGTVGGLNDGAADPTGLFLFREETEEIARRLMPDKEITGPQRVAYILDLTQPSGLFLARDLYMRDGDTLYVTTAPFVRFRTILGAVAPLINFGGSVRNLGGF
jgi:polysaccharide export outer membrane protein